MYKCPIELITTDIMAQITKNQEEQVLRAVQGVGVNVDKDELLKALIYDRQQYQKGYQDGRKEAVANLIERLKMNCFVMGEEEFVYLSDIVSIAEEMGCG